MAIIKSGATSDLLTIDPTSKAARVTLYDSAGRETSLQSKPTYAAASTFAPAVTATDMITIHGSASKTVRVISIYVGTQTTAAGSIELRVIKRSTAASGPGFNPATMVPLDSNDPAATANVGHWTTNPTLGTAVGNTNIVRVATPVLLPASFAGIREDSGQEMLPWYASSHLDKPIVLRGTGEALAINYNGAALVAGQIHNYRVVWIEE